MALCKVIKTVPGWNIGDHIEAFEHRLKELVDEGIVEVIETDVFPEIPTEPSIDAPKKRGRKKKGA